MDMSKYRGIYLSETKEHLQNMNQQVLIVEKDPSNRDGIDALFREAHSIKGMAASMGYQNTAELSHHLEDLMDGFRKTGTVPSTAVDRLLAGIDLLEGLVEDVAAERPERKVADFITNPPPPTPETGSSPREASPPPLPPGALQMTVALAADAPAPAARALLILRTVAGLGVILACTPPEETIRQGGAIELLEIRLQTDGSPEDLKERLAAMADVAHVTVATAPKAEPSRRKFADGRTIRLRTEVLDRFVNLTGELLTSRYALQAACDLDQWENVREGVAQLARQITDLHHHVLQVRLMPLSIITERLPRLVRDLCRETGKEATLEISGEDVRLDRAILEELADPLIHMVRNAIDHGLESSGTVTVTARREKDLVLLEVADNGRGIDPDAIRRKALEGGLISPTRARSLARRDLLQLICSPGFSTAGAVTRTSGRGVGMDVVKAAAENLGGTLEIDSAPGRGTRFRLQLPASVSIIRILLVECAGHTLGIPITRIYRNLEVSRNEIRSARGRLSLSLPPERTEEEDPDGKEGVEEIAVPLLSLRKILRLPGAPFRGLIPVVVTESRGSKVGLVVDRLVGHREIFAKPLAPPLDRLPGVSGATILGDGRVIFLIDPQVLLEKRLAPSASRGGKEIQ